MGTNEFRTEFFVLFVSHGVLSMHFKRSYCWFGALALVFAGVTWASEADAAVPGDYVVNYDLGYDTGYPVGYSSGYDTGYSVGHDLGFPIGYDEGYERVTKQGTRSVTASDLKLVPSVELPKVAPTERLKAMIVVGILHIPPPTNLPTLPLSP